MYFILLIEKATFSKSPKEERQHQKYHLIHNAGFSKGTSQTGG
jgi:hypothetical protein